MTALAVLWTVLNEVVALEQGHLESPQRAAHHLMRHKGEVSFEVLQNDVIARASSI
jgi:hypothetical protein